MKDRGKVKLFANRSGEDLAEKISENLNLRLSKLDTRDFADSSSMPILKDTVRGCDTYLVQCCFDPTSNRSLQDNFWEFLKAGDALRRAGAYKVNGILSYYPFAREDKTHGREPLSASLVAKYIEVTGFDNIITSDLHAKQIEGFFNETIIDNLPADKYLIDYIKNHHPKFLEGAKVISPDTGGAKRAEKYSSELGIKAAQAFKMRDLDSANKVDELKIAGLVDGKKILVVDDMIDTAGSLDELANKLEEIGSEDIKACCTYALLNTPSDPNKKSAIEIINSHGIKVITTDLIPRTEEWKEENPWYHEVSVAPFLAQAIRNLNQNQSISDLYNNHQSE
jgi:ribose-phosphate pyrophosphokinase